MARKHDDRQQRMFAWVRKLDAVFTVCSCVVQVMASDDGGQSWQRTGTIRPMTNPELVRCKSGIYAIGSNDKIAHANNVTISKMLDEGGSKCARFEESAVMPLPVARIYGVSSWNSRNVIARCRLHLRAYVRLAAAMRRPWLTSKVVLPGFFI
jgi:hypothetical protein